MGTKHTIANMDQYPTGNKRQKLTNDDEASSKTAENLTSDDLKRLLTFNQDAGPQARDNVRRVQTYLQNAAEKTRPGLDDEVSQSLSGYFRTTVPAEIGQRSMALPDVMQTWSFAAQFENDALFTAVTSLLALLLRAVSTDLRFRQAGIAVCQTVLLDDQVKLLEKGLAQARGKEQLASACLRLLTEVVSFDGGACSRSLYRHKNVLFSRMDEFMTVRTKPSETARNKHSRNMRHSAVQFLLANLRVQASEIKSDILGDIGRGRALFQHLDEDSSSDMVSILQTMDVFFLSDSHIQRSVKSRIMSESALSAVESLGRYSGDEADPDGRVTSDAVHKFLLRVCSTPNMGVLIESNGWYVSSDAEGERRENRAEGSAAIAITNKHVPWPIYKERIPVRNVKLSFFIQDLRPYKDMKHRELLLAIFKAAPELVADYSMRKKNFSLEGKLTSTWIGYSGFLFALAQIDPPPLDSTKSLPAPSIVVENILPASASKQVFTKCIVHSPKLVSMLAVKLLIASLHKLRKVFGLAGEVPDALRPHAWYEKIIQSLEDRLPELQVVTSAAKNCTQDQPQLYEALNQLSALYYEVVPSLCFGVTLEISVPLADAITALEGTSNSKLDILNVQHLSEIASQSSSEFNWFWKPDRLPLSPFSTILRLLVADPGSQLHRLIEPVAYQHFFFLQDAGKLAWGLFVQVTKDFATFEPLFKFLDNCFLRLAQKPVKYAGELDVLGGSDNSEISLLTLVVLEQWPHLGKLFNESDTVRLSEWLASWLSGSFQLGEDRKLLPVILDKFVQITNCKDARKFLRKVDLDTQFDVSKVSVVATADSEAMEVDLKTSTTDPVKDKFAADMAAATSLAPESEDFPQLLRWSRKPIVDAVEDGDIAALLGCISLDNQSARLQAIGQIKVLAAKVRESDYDEKQQLYLLLMELMETCAQWGTQEPLPAFAGALASEAVSVLNDPAHFIYPKLNKFLMRAPEWDPGHLPSYWKDKVFAREPSRDDAYPKEAEWLCDVLFDGLKMPKDVDICRRRQVFETLLVRYNSLSASFRTKVMKLLWRCTFIEGGSTTLVTRCGIIAWCDALVPDLRAQSLKERVLATCDKDRVQGWSAGIYDTQTLK